ncbi:DUF1796 family putative cysteine peptidase [Methylobacterium trifolii]|uniref:Peptidase n=1 Tax=Methylobacterium trifolii TaxID=1003092 RepID=A0ABQ4TZ61_9HYPH|nr:DUF1796 family putative cysteine peptidase [Methylobacterium trifolii]GJE59907.1 hypothetical protein MPOCJGCO_2009 [Methylobacterium trifolii]
MSPGGVFRGALGRLGLRLGRGEAREPGADNHVSLGSHCQMAHALKTLNLRHWSGPFDWIFSMPGMARDCLADDFAALLDRTQLETIPEAERRGPDIWRGRHRLYRARHGLECIFNHHDPAGSEADYAFLADGVRRLRTALDSAGTRNRFWMMTHLHTPQDVAIDICDLLAQRRSRNHLTFLQLLPGRPACRVEATEIRPDLRWLTVETPSAPVGLRLADPADDAVLIAAIAAEAARAPAAFP